MQGKTWRGHDNWFNEPAELTWYPNEQLCLLNISCHVYPSPEGWMSIGKTQFCRGFSEEPKNLTFGDTTITLNADGTLITSGDELF